MNSKIDPVRIIKETRQEKHVFTLSKAELVFLAKQTALSGDEKVLWLLLAMQSAEDESLACPFFLDQLIEMTKMSYARLVHSLQQLEALGYLIFYTQAQEDRCQVRLPNSGLLDLRLASKKVTPQWLKNLRLQTGKEVFMWW